jgi:hypothetical protein
MDDHRILIIDVEATCWRRSPSTGEAQEIIEPILFANKDLKS